MAPLVVSALMWTLVLVLLIFRRARKERSILFAAIAIAMSMLLSEDGLYLVVDGWFGSRDIMHLVSAVTLMVGVYYLAKAVTQLGTVGYLFGRVGKIALAAAIMLTTVSFFLVPHHGGTSTTFMLTYGDSLAAAMYSTTQYVYIALVVAAMAITAVETLRAAGLPRERAAAILLLVGSVFGVTLAATVITMNMSNLNEWDRTLAVGQSLYFPLQIITFGFLCTGLALAPIVRWVVEYRRAHRVDEYLTDLATLWQEAITARPSSELPSSSSDPENRLHRRIVEIRDAAMDSRNDFELDTRERQMLAEAEEHLMAGAW